MQLPQIPSQFDLLNQIHLPFEVPLLVHPIVVHFAVVLPVIVLLLELANLAFKRRAVSVTSLSLLLLAVVVYIAAFFTGKADGSEAWPMLGDDAQAELKLHKLIGTYLVYALIIPLLLKLLAMLVRAKWARIILILSLVGFIAGVFKQGHDGGELVYEYGVNVGAVAEHQEALEDLRDEMSDMNETVAEQEEEITSLESELDACKAKAQEGFGDKVSATVSEAVDSVKKVFSDDNVSEAPAIESDEGITAVDTPPAAEGNDTAVSAHDIEAATQAAVSEAADESTEAPENAAPAFDGAAAAEQPVH